MSLRWTGLFWPLAGVSGKGWLVQRCPPHLEHYTFSCLDAAARWLLTGAFQLSVPCSRALMFHLLHEQKAKQLILLLWWTSNTRIVMKASLPFYNTRLHFNTMFQTRFGNTWSISQCFLKQPRESVLVLSKRSGSSQEKVIGCFSGSLHSVWAVIIPLFLLSKLCYLNVLVFTFLTQTHSKYSSSTFQNLFLPPKPVAWINQYFVLQKGGWKMEHRSLTCSSGHLDLFIPNNLY